MKFSKLILESDSNILYHRSEYEFKEGQILEAHLSKKYNNDYENELEKYRLDNYPYIKPSRKHCFFASPTDKSRFHYRGFLYQIKPIGITHTSNSNIIDTLANAYYDGFTKISQKLIYEYWNPGVKWVNKNQIRNIEILCNKIQIISKITKQSELFKNDKIKCIKEFEYEIESYKDYPYTIQEFQKAIDANIIKDINIRKFIIKKNTIWNISEIHKANDSNLNKLNGNLYALDLTNNNFTIELIISENNIVNLNKFIKEHFIKL